MLACPHHTLADSVWAHPYVTAALIGWIALCIAAAGTAHAFAGLIRRHARRP